MNWFSRLFKKSPNLAGQGKNWMEGKKAFEDGFRHYSNNDFSKALQFFDSAIKCGFEIKTYECRGFCLQALEFDLDAIEDFGKAISMSPDDCNLYYSRAISKGTICDFKGQIEDLEKAISLSKVNNELNKMYAEDRKRNGWRGGHTGVFEMALFEAKMGLQSELSESSLPENLRRVFNKKKAGFKRRAV